MHRAGVPVDRRALEQVVAEARAEVADLEAGLRKSLGITRLTDSQLLPALARIGIAVDRTGKHALAHHIDHPVAFALMRFHRVRAFVDDLGTKLIEVTSASKDGRVRPRINRLGAVTGRMSYEAPNLQGLPRDPRIRRCISAKAGNVLVRADYSAIDLRVAAQVTGDKELRSGFAAGLDPHRLLAARVTGKAAALVSDDEREAAKPINFGVLYGMGPAGLAQSALVSLRMKMTLNDARSAHAAHKALFVGIAAWQDRIDADREPVMRNSNGRLRRFEDAEGLPKRLNFTIQSLAADGMKRAMVLVDRELHRFDARLVLAVHDELVIECAAAAAHELESEVALRMSEAMSESVPDVPIVVDTGHAQHWTKRFNPL